MSDGSINIIGTAEDLRRINPWLEPFNLTDAEVLALIKLIGDAIWGDIDLDEFWQKLQQYILRDAQTQKKIAVAASRRRLMDFKDDIGDVEGFIKKLGGDNIVEAPIVKKAPDPEEINKKLAQYDWNKIVGIERRALLEEIGVSLKDFVRWLAERK